MGVNSIPELELMGNSNFGIQIEIGIYKFGIEVCYQNYLLWVPNSSKPVLRSSWSHTRWWQLQTGYNVRFILQTGLVPEWWVSWCLWSADFPGCAILANNSSRVYGNALFGIDKFDVELELTRWNWNWPDGIEWNWNWPDVWSFYKYIVLKLIS